MDGGLNWRIKGGGQGKGKTGRDTWRQLTLRAIWGEYRDLIQKKSFLKYIHVWRWLHEITKCWGVRAPSGHLLLSNEASNTGIRLFLIELLAKGVLWNHQTTEVVSRTIDCYIPTDSKFSVAKDNTHTTHWTWNTWTGAYIEPLLEDLAFFCPARLTVLYLPLSGDVHGPGRQTFSESCH